MCIRDRHKSTQNSLLSLHYGLVERGVAHGRVLGMVDRILRRSRGVKLADAIERCIESKRTARCRARYLKQLRHILGKFRDAHPNRTVDQIDGAEIEKWLHRGKYATQSSRSHLSDIRTLFSYCVRQGWCPTNPRCRVEPIRVVRGVPGILSPDDAARLMRVAHEHDPRLCAHLALSSFCGIRPEELDKLTADKVLLEQRLVDVDATVAKTARRRLVAIPENAVPWLQLEGDYAEVRSYRGKRHLRGIRNLKKRFDRIRRLAGLYESWPHDAMRHSAASYLYALKEDAGYVAKQLGNSVNILLTHYNATKTPDGRVVTSGVAQQYFAINPPGDRCVAERAFVEQANA